MKIYYDGEPIHFDEDSANAIFETKGPAKTVAITSSDGLVSDSVVRPISLITYKRESGDVSVAEPKNISGYESIVLTHNDQPITQELGEEVYGGTYNWRTGELIITHKLFELPISAMNNSNTYPGWMDVPDLDKCFAQDKSPITIISNIASRASVSSIGNRNVLYFNKSHVSDLSQSELIEQYGSTTAQFLFELLEPRTIDLAKHQIVAKVGNNTFTSDCGDTTVKYKIDTKEYIDKSGNTYSSEEIVIGTWIDGKPLYRQVVTGVSGENNANSVIGNISAEIDTVPHIYGTMFESDDHFYALPHSNVSLYIAKSTGRIMMYIKDRELAANKPVITIVEYTKTTD